MKRVVVDACVTVAAGAGVGEREPAPESVAVLDAIRDRGRQFGDVRLAMNRELEAEWTAGEGEYAQIWLADMMSRRLVDQVEGGWDDEGELLRCASNNHRKPILHDIHLVRLAMTTDQRLVTLENKLPKYLRATVLRSGRPASLRSLHVVSPVRPTSVGWIDAGAPEDQTWYLIQPDP